MRSLRLLGTSALAAIDGLIALSARDGDEGIDATFYPTTVPDFISSSLETTVARYIGSAAVDGFGCVSTPSAFRGSELVGGAGRRFSECLADGTIRGWAGVGYAF